VGELHAVTSGDSNPDLVIKISNSVPIIATFRVTPKWSESGFYSGVGLCGIWGFNICSRNWGCTSGFDYSRLWMESGVYHSKPNHNVLELKSPEVAKISHKGRVQGLFIERFEHLAPIPSS